MTEPLPEKPCPKARNRLAHEAHQWHAGRYLPVGDLGEAAWCPGVTEPTSSAPAVPDDEALTALIEELLAPVHRNPNGGENVYSRAAAALGRLRDEAAALRAEVADMREPEITDADLGSILDLKLDGNGLDMRLKPSERLMRAVVGSLKATLDEAEAENYVEMRASDPESGFEYVMTVVRPGKPTPHTMRQRAEAERDAAQAEAAALRVAVEGLPVHAIPPEFEAPPGALMVWEADLAAALAAGHQPAEAAALVRGESQEEQR